MGFIEQYFIGPIWDRTGYNPVNTLVYALIALAAAYAMYSVLRRERIRIDRNFILSVVPFVLLGSTVRSLVDAADRGSLLSHASSYFGFLGFVYETHVYDYGYLTVTPGIYVVVGLLTFSSILVANRLKKPFLAPLFGSLLWLFHLVLLLPMMDYWVYGPVVLGLTILGTGAGFLYLRRLKVRAFSAFAVFAHAFDGAATFVTIDIWNRFESLCTERGHCYGEQHVLSDALGQFGNLIFAPIGGFFLFYLVKVLFSTFAAQVVEKDSKGEEREFILLLLIIFGLAPGMRNMLTLLMGA
jgi:uncharacterized membrane protein